MSRSNIGWIRKTGRCILMSHEIIAVLTVDEVELLMSKFSDYSQSLTDIQPVNDYKKLLGVKYNFEWDRISINGKGEVRMAQQMA